MPGSIEIPPRSVNTLYPGQLMHYQCANKKCKWDLNEFLQFVTVRKQKVLMQTNLIKYWCMSGRITFSKRCFKVSLGKGFDESKWYNQKEQVVMDKSFVLFWIAHSAGFACVWHCSNDSEFYRSLSTQKNEAKELSKLEWISMHYQCNARILQSKSWWNCVWEASGKFPQKNWIQFLLLLVTSCCIETTIYCYPAWVSMKIIWIRASSNSFLSYVAFAC